MLRPLRNHEAGSAAQPAVNTQLSQPTRRNGGLLVRADAEKTKVSYDD